MRLARIDDPNAIRPLHVVLICLVMAGVGGGFMLLSAAEPPALPDGAIPWNEESPLRAVVRLLCLNYQSPTIYADAVKRLSFGLATGLATLALGFALLAGTRSANEVHDDGDISFGAGQQDADTANKRQVTPLLAAQLLAGLYVIWSFASASWSGAKYLALGGSVLLAIQVLWAYTLSIGLSARAAGHAVKAFVGMCVAMALVAIWYHYGRKPEMRVDFPVGDPISLAACLIPGILLSIGWLFAWVGKVRTRQGGAVWIGLLIIVIIVAQLWAFALARSRGPAVGLLLGMVAMAFFAVRGRQRWIPVIAACLLTLAGSLYLTGTATGVSPDSRSATLRLRTYSWNYAWQLFTMRPLTGHGQGGFVRLGDAFAAQDVIADSPVFETRIAHAHNEWLEVLADLGSIGLVLIVGTLVMTFRAGVSRSDPPKDVDNRWLLIALLASLVGLVVEECFHVGLRLSGVPIAFYTVVGLTWATCGTNGESLAAHLSQRKNRRRVCGVAGCVMGLAAVVLSQQDFAAARSGMDADAAFAKGDMDEAIELTRASLQRLNPQRALTNLYRLGAAHLRAAQQIGARGRDRLQRASVTQPPNPRLLAFSRADFRLSNEHCDLGRQRIAQLVEYAPRFFNSGWLEYWLDVTQVANLSREESGTRGQLLFAAVVAMERELERQPFVGSLAVDYVRAAAGRRDLSDLIDVLARPLRQGPIPGGYADAINLIRSNPAFEQEFQSVLLKTLDPAAAAKLSETSDSPAEQWAPEKLRLAATIRFRQGDLSAAKVFLNQAVRAYELLPRLSPLGAAGCHEELAACLFTSDPQHPAPALENARRAIALAPDSFPGRQFSRRINGSIINYLLASDNEEETTELLREIGPTHATDAEVLAELGARYRRLCETLLFGRGGSGGRLNAPPQGMLEKMTRWIRRAIELTPNDERCRYIAAQLSLSSGEPDRVVEHLRAGLRLGLQVELVRGFLDEVNQLGLANPAMKTLAEELMPANRSGHSLKEARPEDPVKK